MTGEKLGLIITNHRQHKVNRPTNSWGNFIYHFPRYLNNEQLHVCDQSSSAKNEVQSSSSWSRSSYLGSSNMSAFDNEFKLDWIDVNDIYIERSVGEELLHMDD